MSDAERISSFQVDGMSRKARKARAKVTARRPVQRRPDSMGPTPERLAKADAPVKMAAGLYRAPMPIERMRDRGQLDTLPHVNEAMFLAAEKLVGLFEGAGLATTMKAQDLTRVIGSAGEGADVHAAHCLLEFRKALALMGWMVRGTSVPRRRPHHGRGGVLRAGPNA